MMGLKKFVNQVIAQHSAWFFLVIILIIVLIGTVFYHIIEWWNFFDSFYFVTVTMATVGYGDMAPITHWGKILAIFYGFMGAPLFIWLTGVILQTKFNQVIKRSIHAYHQEAKEAKMIALQNKKALKQQKKDIEEIQEEVGT